MRPVAHPYDPRLTPESLVFGRLAPVSRPVSSRTGKGTEAVSRSAGSSLYGFRQVISS
ncbi:hypothetical protein AWB67_06395 [Caballeronia terrestris]|jgi:hypothetical protein|uniref:Uncharacterized protein n=2 Tax=Caballeronia TaxID=1827195 RepID=A0A7Z7N051_9BURK|nr:hypothetical protein AWB81_04537 [Caballeronia arationis]SAL83394.1 hypothetical protein AWB67_06395 [Caballeronia terrestris]SOE45824.1 hypothetical protein SAMN05446927_0079 [Caballeronia arationis]